MVQGRHHLFVLGHGLPPAFWGEIGGESGALDLPAQAAVKLGQHAVVGRRKNRLVDFLVKGEVMVQPSGPVMKVPSP